jgi:hypothetical protein
LEVPKSSNQRIILSLTKTFLTGTSEILIRRFQSLSSRLGSPREIIDLIAYHHASLSKRRCKKHYFCSKKAFLTLSPVTPTPRLSSSFSRKVAKSVSSASQGPFPYPEFQRSRLPRKQHTDWFLLFPEKEAKSVSFASQKIFP